MKNEQLYDLVNDTKQSLDSVQAAIEDSDNSLLKLARRNVQSYLRLLDEEVKRRQLEGSLS